MERKKAELVELTKTKEEMDMALANSPLKRQTSKEIWNILLFSISFVLEFFF